MAGAPILFPRGREVVLGVSAGIAAYKSCELLRRLQDHGFLITVIPTESSLNFVGKATWQALSGREVHTTVWEDSASVSHVTIANDADLIIVAPATADVISRLAQGRADDLLTTTFLASSAPKIVVPAMHPGMWLNTATQSNVQTLRQRGVLVLDPVVGRLTGTDSGIGRFPETKDIIEKVLQVTKTSSELLGRKLLVTAGGTVETIDPVRYIGNRSSGRQGLAVAYEALRAGAQVTVVAGNTDFFELSGARVLSVESALEMHQVVEQEFPEHDALVMSAAVADVRPQQLNDAKIKKESLSEISLTANPDILMMVGRNKRVNQVVVGFAAETESNFLELGKEKMVRKGADFLFVNNVAQGAVFGQSATSGALLSLQGVQETFSNVDKHIVARSIISNIARKLEGVHG